MSGPDASWWDGLHRDIMPTNQPALEAEVRRLRAELLRVQDELGLALERRNWTTLLATATRVRDQAEKALASRA